MNPSVCTWSRVPWSRGAKSMSRDARGVVGTASSSSTQRGGTGINGRASGVARSWDTSVPVRDHNDTGGTITGVVRSNETCADFSDYEPKGRARARSVRDRCRAVPRLFSFYGFIFGFAGLSGACSSQPLKVYLAAKCPIRRRTIDCVASSSSAPGCARILPRAHARHRRTTTRGKSDGSPHRQRDRRRRARRGGGLRPTLHCGELGIRFDALRVPRRPVLTTGITAWSLRAASLRGDPCIETCCLADGFLWRQTLDIDAARSYAGPVAEPTIRAHRIGADGMRLPRFERMVGVEMRRIAHAGSAALERTQRSSNRRSHIRLALPRYPVVRRADMMRGRVGCADGGGRGALDRRASSRSRSICSGRWRFQP